MLSFLILLIGFFALGWKYFLLIVLICGGLGIIFGLLFGDKIKFPDWM